jgi:conjugal transfer/type IV secretion protein DotA/TraY
MKRLTLFNLLLMVVVAILPHSVFATSSSADPTFSWDFDTTYDKSLEYLGIIFGQVGSNFKNSPGNNLIGDLFSVFNMAVLTLGTIVVSYTIVLSTINTAQEGEVMGRKFSSVWIPLRSALGIAFLLPTKGGYSVLQVMMMSIVVYGVSAADQIWSLAIDNLANSPTGAAGEVKVDNKEARKLAASLYSAAVCVQTLNTNADCKLALNNKTADWTDVGYYGVKAGVSSSSDTKMQYLCGFYMTSLIPPLPADKMNITDWYSANQAAINAAIPGLMAEAQNALSGGSPTKDFIQTAADQIKAELKGTPVAAVESVTTGDLAETKKLGWIFAGSYYTTLTHLNANNLTYGTPTATSGDISPVGSTCLTAYATSLGTTTTYLAKSSTYTSSGAGSLSIPEVKSSNRTAQFVDAIAAPLKKAVEDFNNTLTTNDPKDPVASVANVGSTILAVAQDIWFAVMAAAILLMLGGCIMSGIQPFCWVFGAIITLLVPILNIIIALLWGVGAMLGIYVPMIPYIVYTFTALGWILLVIETIVAAPIVALGLVSPAEGHLGKAAPAVLLITNVFLRPSLMVIGLMVSITLVKAVINMLNFGFSATINATVSGLGVFGLIALLCLYGGTALTLIHECFSIIHILPDKVIRWIGGQAEQSQVKQHLEAAKGQVAKGAEMGGKAMQMSAAEMEKLGKDAKSKGTGIGGIDKLGM